MANIDAEELKLLMSAMNLSKEERSKAFDDEDIPKHIDRLKRYYSVLTNKAEDKIEVGGLVVWKEGMKNRKRPLYDEPAVVIQLADSEDDAHFDPSNDSGSSYYREPLTIQLGVIDSDGELSLYYFDRRRFRPFGK